MCWPPREVCLRFFFTSGMISQLMIVCKKSLHSLTGACLAVDRSQRIKSRKPKRLGQLRVGISPKGGHAPTDHQRTTWDFYPWTGDIRSLRFSLQQCMMIFYTNAFGNVYLRICFLCIHQYAIYCFHLSWRLLPSSTIWFLHPSLNIFGQFQMPMPLEAKKSTDHKEFKSHIQKTYSGPVLAHLEIGSEHE